jgi:hypothetical protein
MANVYATRTGNWSDTTIWNTSALPTVNDDVYANNFTITVDLDVHVLSFRTRSATGINSGGQFRPNNDVTMIGNVAAGTSTAINFLLGSPNSFTLIGDVSGSNGGNFSSVRGILNSSSGTINIIGNVIQSESSGNVTLTNDSTGTVNLTGSLTSFLAPQYSFSYIARNLSTGAINIIGNVIGGNGTNSRGILNNSSGTVNIRGRVLGGYSAIRIPGAYGIENRSSGLITVLGDVYGAQGVNSYGIINNSSSGVIQITGNVSGFSTTVRDPLGNVDGYQGFGVRNSGFLTVYGDVSSGNLRGDTWGIYNETRGAMAIYGNVYGSISSNSDGIRTVSNNISYVYGTAFPGIGAGAFGIRDSSTSGIIYIKKSIGNAFGIGSSGIQSVPGVFGSQTSYTIVEELECGSRGQWPTAGNILLLPKNTSTITLYTSALTASPATALFTSLSTSITPPASSVRLGTKYNLNNYTGTCAMPSVSSVLQGVAVDNSIGIAALQPQTVWSVPTSAIDTNSLGGRLKESATVQSFGQLLTAFNM